MTKPQDDERLSIDAAILAGGFGTRLRPVVADRPKALAFIGGRPFVAFLLDQLEGAGLSRVVMCTGYRGDQMQEELGERFGALDIAYSKEEEALGTAGALRLAANYFRSDSVLVLNGDSYCQVDLNALMRTHRERQADVSIVLTEVGDASRFGSVNSGADGKIVSFGEKVPSSGGGWINAGIYLISRPLIDEIPTGRAVSLEREMFPQWVGGRFYGYRHRGLFVDIGTPASYAATAQLFQSTGIL